jgi:hypothetical protein
MPIAARRWHKTPLLTTGQQGRIINKKKGTIYLMTPNLIAVHPVCINFDRDAGSSGHREQ